MNENPSKYLDDLSKKVIANGKVESPSFNFTNAVMTQVEALSKKKVTVYQPLISKKVWVLISVGFLAVLFYIIFSVDQTASAGWLSKIDFNVLSNNNVSNVLSSFKFSKTLMYAVVFLGLMIFIQIPLLKNHFDKRFEL